MVHHLLLGLSGKPARTESYRESQNRVTEFLFSFWLPINPSIYRGGSGLLLFTFNRFNSFMTRGVLSELKNKEKNR
jgi:hypothetical protein